MIIEIIILIALIKVSLHYNEPPVLAGIYTVATTLISVVVGIEFYLVFISATIAFGLTWLFFELLDRFEDSGVWWILVLIFPALILALS